MIINSVSNVNFKGTTYTKNNNEYKKTYIGRIVGTGVGIALAIAAVRVKKGVGNVGKFSQKFKPVLDRASNTDFIILGSNQHQVFGRFSGKAILDDGTEINIKDFMGFAEKVRNKW